MEKIIRQFPKLKTKGILLWLFVLMLLWTQQSMAAPGDVLWTYPAGESCRITSPAIGSDGTVYMGASDKNLYAINPDGTLKWKYALRVYSCMPSAIGCDGTIYIGTGSDGYLYAINPDGTLKWEYPAGDISLSLAIDSDGTVYFGGDGCLCAVNADGTLKWKFETGSVKSPVIGADGTVYTGAYIDGYVYAVNPDGTLKWKYQADDAEYLAVGSDGTIYSVGNRGFYAIKDDGDRATLKWFYEIYHSGSAPAIGNDGTLYATANNSGLLAINTADGSLKWSYPIGCSLVSPVIDSDGTIYVITPVAIEIYAINPDGSVKWSSQQDIFAVTPSLVIDPDGTIYISEDTLYAIEGASPWTYSDYVNSMKGYANSPWPRVGQNNFGIQRQPLSNKISVSTNLSEAAYTLTGAATLSGSGTLWSQSEVCPGEYTVTYNPADCWQAPASQTKTLSANGTVTFTGTYTDIAAPEPPGNLQPSPQPETWTNNKTVEISWTPGTDCGSGVAGYRYTWDTKPLTQITPDNSVQISQTQITSPPLSDGDSHYFHICTADHEGNISTTVSAGPFYIDTTAPAPPSALNSDPAINTWTEKNTIAISWDAGEDQGSGVAGYSYLWSTELLENPDQTLNKITEKAGTSTISEPLEDGKTHYFYVRTIDNVGNASIVKHHGPFYIDTTDPEPPTFLDSTPPVRAWVSQNTVTVNWNPGDDGEGSGVAGYSYIWDTNASSEPDTTPDTTDTSAVSPSLEDGNSRYFHIRTLDKTDKSSTTEHWGPFYTDTGKPCSEASSCNAQEGTGIIAVSYTANDSYNGDSESSGSGVKKTELWVKRPGSVQYQLAATDNQGAANGTFEYKTDADGEHRFYTLATDNAGNTEDIPDNGYDLACYSSQFAGYAILAIGSVKDQEGIASHTVTANNIYKHLIRRNFVPDHIKYFNPNDESQDGEDEYSGSYKEAIRDAVTVIQKQN